MNEGDGLAEHGKVLVSRHFDYATMSDRIRIRRADPRALISSELLDQISDGKCAPWATIDGEQLDVITLTDSDGQKFIYRLGNYNVLHDAYEMEWPD